MKKIAVLVSIGRHPVSGAARYSRNDAAALSIGLELSRQHGAALDVLHAGDASNVALQEYLALGASCVEVLPVVSGAASAATLAFRLRGYDLVLTGTRAEAGMGSGMLPYHLSAALGLPMLNDAVDVAFDGDEGQVTVRQFLPKGVRRRIAAPLPALVAVHPMANAPTHYAYARLRAGRIEASSAIFSDPTQATQPAQRMQPTAPAASAGQQATQARIDSGGAGDRAAWTWQAARAKPVRLAAAEKRSGHARMLSATTTESRGGSVVNEGSPVEKAQVILAYLREHQLVDY